jgi:hypothetical protein
MDEAIEEYPFKDTTIRIVFDDYPESPREWDNVGTMVHWHPNYTLGDRELDDNERRAMERGGFELLERYMRLAKKAVTVLPLSIYDHSGVTMWVGSPFTDGYRGWDSSFVGFIYTTTEDIEKMGTPAERVDDVLRGEVKDFDQYLTGQVYGYQIIKDDEVIDSCSGFYDIKDVKMEAEANV